MRIRENGKTLIYVFTILMVGALMATIINNIVEQRIAVSEFEKKLYMCQQSMIRTSENLKNDRSFLVLSPKDITTYMHYTQEMAQNLYAGNELNRFRPSLLYLEDLYQFILIDELDNSELFELCAGPLLQTHFSDSLWAFLDELDLYLQTDDGAKTYATLAEYQGATGDTQFVSYCCVQAEITGIPCIHEKEPAVTK